MKIDIIFQSDLEISGEDLYITINKKIIDNLTITKDSISFEQESVHGFSMVELKSTKQIYIKDFKINTNSIRELIYLSFLLENNQKLQPRTDIQTPSQTWCMPIVYPLSSFFSFIQNNLPNGYLGKNLFDYFNIFYPESVEISTAHPKILQNYFKYDSYFTIIPKDSICNETRNIPFYEIDLHYDFNTLLNEVKTNLSFIDFDKHKPNQYNINNQEFAVRDPWKKSYFMKSTNKDFIADIDYHRHIADDELPWAERFAWDIKKWPCLFKFLKLIPAKTIVNGYLAELPAGSFIYPHADNVGEKYFKNDNPAVMYVPLCNPENVFFKFANSGLVNLNKISLINNKRFSHAVVNDSDTARYILNINFKRL
jgi:hypothetical protein